MKRENLSGKTSDVRNADTRSLSSPDVALLERVLNAGIAMERQTREDANCPGPRGCKNPTDHPTLSRFRAALGQLRGEIRRLKKEVIPVVG